MIIFKSSDFYSEFRPKRQNMLKEAGDKTAASKKWNVPQGQRKDAQVLILTSCHSQAYFLPGWRQLSLWGKSPPAFNRHPGPAPYLAAARWAVDSKWQWERRVQMPLRENTGIPAYSKRWHNQLVSTSQVGPSPGNPSSDKQAHRVMMTFIKNIKLLGVTCC